MSLVFSIPSDASGLPLVLAPYFARPLSHGAGKEARAWDERLKNAIEPSPSRIVRTSRAEEITDETLFSRLSELATNTSSVAMHLDNGWRASILRQLVTMLSPEEWEKTDFLPVAASFTTFLRMITYWKFVVTPGISILSTGNVASTWTRGADRLTVESLVGDQIRWVLSRIGERGRETAAGTNNLTRLEEVIAPYHFEKWIINGQVR